MFATQPFLVLAELSTNCQRRVVLHPPDFIIFPGGRYLAKGVNNDATEPIKKVGVALAGSIALTALPLAHSRKNSRGSSQPRGPYSALRLASALVVAGRARLDQAAGVRLTAVSNCRVHSQLESCRPPGHVSTALEE
jgi:hypothetical protein